MSACNNLAMSKVTLDDHQGPWTEEEFLALDETNYRLELLDGSLWVSPGPNGPHQDISGDLRDILKRPARTKGLWARYDMNVRLAPGKIMRPDVIVAKGPRLVTNTEASDVLLVCEVTSPSNATTDRVLKMSLYAAAKIQWYLLVEPDMPAYESLTVRLFRLETDAYVEHAVATDRETLTLDDPFTVSITPAELLAL